MYICSLPIIALIMAAVCRGHRPLEVMYSDKAADVLKKAAQQEASIRQEKLILARAAWAGVVR
jgi:hypothetical protein